MTNAPLRPLLTVRGARAHNLKNVTLSMPRNAFVVITGVSGSGKSTLAFDTIYAEGQRRYVESLSAYARQFLGLMEKPDVDSIEGLSPAISIDQKTTSHNPRSTVGTVTEIHDHLRLLFARAGQPHCPECGRKIESQSPSEIVDRLLAEREGQRAILLAPVVRGRKGEHRAKWAELRREGFSRVRVNGAVLDLEEAVELSLSKNEKHDIDVVIDRVIIRESDRQRLAESAELGLLRGDGLLRVMFPDDDGAEALFSEHFACPEHGTVLEELEPRSFSFNNHYGACEECGGLGHLPRFTAERVVDAEKSLAEGAIVPWTGKRGSEMYNWEGLRVLADHLGFDLKAPWNSLSEDIQRAVLHGVKGEIPVIQRRAGRESLRYNLRFEGVLPNLQRRFAAVESDTARERLAEFMELQPCEACGGTRYKAPILAVRVAGLNIAEVGGLSVVDAIEFFSKLGSNSVDEHTVERIRTGATAGKNSPAEPQNASTQLGEFAAAVTAPILRSVESRLRFLADVGLDYLSLDRSANTLSGGEAQRIRLATQVGSGLTGVLYVLDEPSIGLHPKDNERLISTLKNLRDLGNTLLVVEHDEDTMRAADWLIDMGPGAGAHGGAVVASGTPDEVAADDRSLTGAYLRGEKFVPMPSERRGGNGKKLRVVGAREHNLQNVIAEIPLGTMTVFTGPSGSGKSTLVRHILHASLARDLNRARTTPGVHDRIEGTEHLDKVIEIDQTPIGRTPRSNPATYTGVFTEIRELFTRTPEARRRGYQAGRFSFNVKGGRCEHCKGDGLVKIEMNFLPDVYVPCEVCKGSRYNRETLLVEYNGKNIADVLAMTAEDALEFFGDIPAVANKLRLLVDVGLGYVQLGQNSTTLSGGEAQRIKLATELARRATGKTIYILDEPTTGLHFEDVRRLMEVLGRLVQSGNTLVIIEHNLDVIKAADWIIDMGPEGGVRGGQIVAAGTPEELIQNGVGFTAHHLARLPAFAAEAASSARLSDKSPATRTPRRSKKAKS